MSGKVEAWHNKVDPHKGPLIVWVKAGCPPLQIWLLGPPLVHCRRWGNFLSVIDCVEQPLVQCHPLVVSEDHGPVPGSVIVALRERQLLIANCCCRIPFGSSVAAMGFSTIGDYCSNPLPCRRPCIIYRRDDRWTIALWTRWSLNVCVRGFVATGAFGFACW